MSITDSFHNIPFERLVDQRTITAVQHAEDGWSIEVEDVRGVRLTYLIPDVGCIPRVGDTARFFGGIGGHPIYDVEIDGQRVFRAAQAASD
jgi:hypothetical protein